MSEEWKNKRKRFYTTNFSSPKFVIGGIFGIIGVIILGGMVVHFFSQSSKKDQLFLTNQSIEAPEKNSSETKPIDETVSTSTRSVIYVDVKGAVKQPGMYAFVAEDRVFDVIQKAGGLTESADEKQINFAAKITDQQMLYVPEVGEEIPES
ncbi:ComE operon protein 1 [Enterococcus hirae]|nr:SLBB domain-containing protein [Enterococcus hirae]VFA55912.1 ComE operon protein 1 [Enterococcus hirae]VTS68158.1 ComE operon protein 1 [Enterococcus hirae]